MATVASVGYRHSREEILGAAVATAHAGGLSDLTFRSVARSAGTSDRMVVYYFPTKRDLVEAVLQEMGLQLQSLLTEAVSRSPVTHRQMVADVWPSLARPEADVVFTLFLEAVGIGLAGREPFASIGPRLTEAWVDWLETKFAPTQPDRRGEALAAIALLDGLVLLRLLLGPAAAEQAARSGAVEPHD